METDNTVKRGRPVTGRAQSAMQLKQRQRERDETMINEQDSDVWPDRVCLMVLSNTKKWPKDSALAKSAWKRLGILRGFV